MMEAIIVELVQELNIMNFELESDYVRADLVSSQLSPLIPEEYHSNPLSLRAKLADSGANNWVKCTVNLWSPYRQ